MKEKRVTLVLGASANPSRYSFLALHRLLTNDHPVVAIGKKQTIVAGISIETEKINFEKIHTITLYLNPAHQKEYYSYLLSLQPKRIIFNPGAENEEFYELAKRNGIHVENACTLVMLSTGQY